MTQHLSASASRATFNVDPDCQSENGPAGPAGNALKHGLTALTVLPESLRLQTAEFGAELAAELQPVGCLENFLVKEMARHAAGMDLAGHAEGSILRHCALQRSQLDAILNRDELTAADSYVTAAIASQPLEKLGRYRRLHECGLYAALTRLRELQAARHLADGRAQFARFNSEEACAEYLVRRGHQPAIECPHCGGRKGHWLGRRRCWECSSCAHQLGIRSGTVMEGSRLPLRIWFQSIGEVLADPGIRSERLQDAIHLPRLGTVRKLLRAILDAIGSPDADRLLAGLQRLMPPVHLNSVSLPRAI